MTINAGTRLGPYELAAPLGVGGMGEVWRARDTRLERDVAIKILPATLVHNPEFRARFEREAKTISQLNHPNICQIYDVGEAASDVPTSPSSQRHTAQDTPNPSTLYLVMELLDGQTLADRVERGPMPLSDVLRYGAQIADALAAAHRVGIVHRDLKPANIMITKSGAKLLDFGLAKGAENAPVQFDTTDATQHKPLTAKGTILGTFQYMAPEQLEGDEADARTDIFALGCLLYEMLTAQRAFEGKTKTSLIAAIVSGTPRSVTELQPVTPPALEHVISRCLEKQPDDRWQSAQDVAAEMRWIASRNSSSIMAAEPAAARPGRLRRRLVTTAVCLLALVATAAAAAYFTRRSHTPAVLHAELSPERGTSIAEVNLGAAVLAPDGTRLAYLTRVNSATQVALAIRDLRSGVVTALRGSEGATFPFWSPDGESLGFFAEAKLKSISSSGGTVQEICDAPASRGGSWGSDGTIVFAPDIKAPLFRVSEAGGEPVRITDKGADITHRNPYFLPNGKTVLYVVGSAAAKGDVYAGSTEGKLKKLIVKNASNVQYAEPYLLFVRNSNLLAQRFDLRDLSVSGIPQPVAENLEYFQGRELANFSASRNGMLVYRKRSTRLQQLTWYSRDGRRGEDVGPPGRYITGSLSTDGRKGVLGVSDGTVSDIWVMNTVQGTLARATNLKTTNTVSAVLSPDGQRLAISNAVSLRGEGQLWTQPISGAGSRRELGTSVRGLWPVIRAWSRDGRQIVIIVQQNTSGMDIVSCSPDGGPCRPLITGPGNQGVGAALSPDGRWLAYTSEETGRMEIYVTTFPNPGERWQISFDGGSLPRWSADSKELFFKSGNKLMTIPVGTVFEVTQPVALAVDLSNSTWFDVAPDGRFLLAQNSGDEDLNPFHLVVNWSRTLRSQK
ncbi:MAG TPA: protein kinase [Thermoanaerobaculia bacterium]|nr:protein kinase [Thermoanaerobaculia bacterium]